LRRAVDADTHALTLSLAGTFQPDQRLWQESARASELNRRFYARMKTAGVLRADVEGRGLLLHLRTARRDPRHHTATHHRAAPPPLGPDRARSADHQRHPPRRPTPRPDEMNERWTLKPSDHR
jgi:hypothetical protein